MTKEKYDNMDAMLKQLGEVKNNDRDKVRQAIYIMRDIGGMTYKAIACELEQRYKIVRSRQAIQQNYVRYMKSQVVCDEKQRIKDFVINLCARGYMRTEICSKMQQYGLDVSYTEVCSIASENKQAIDETKDNLMTLAVVAALEVYQSGNMDNMKEHVIDRLKYKGDITLSDRCVNEFVGNAYSGLLYHLVLYITYMAKRHTGSAVIPKLKNMASNAIEVPQMGDLMRCFAKAHSMCHFEDGEEFDITNTTCYIQSAIDMMKNMVDW